MAGKTEAKGSAAKEETKAGEWVERPVIAGEGEDLEGEWVAPVDGLEISGVLEKAFVLPDENNDGKFRACYGVRTATGLQLVGERSFFQDAIRAERLGAEVRVVFTHKAQVGNKSPWRGAFASKSGATGQGVKAALMSSYNAQKSRGDLPF